MTRDMMARVQAALPGLDISPSRTLLRRRAREWAWPAFQMALAASLSWLLADRVASDAASYGPIAAIVALGLGRERRLSRSALMVAGLFAGVVAAEIVTPLVGSGWWQIGLLMGVTAVVTGSLIGRDLAVTYATINAVVLLTTPGSDGWVPSRLVAGTAGVVAALAVMLLIVPPHPVGLVVRRLDAATQHAAAALRATVEVLNEGMESDGSGDRRRLLRSARRLDDEIERGHEALDQAAEIVQWSPWRRHDGREVERLHEVAERLQPALRTASTIARLGDRAELLDLSASPELADGMCVAADFIDGASSQLVGDRPVDPGAAHRVRATVDALIDRSPDHAVLVALVEEVRGLLDDLAEIVTDRSDDAAVRFPGARRNGLVFGRA